MDMTPLFTAFRHVPRDDGALLAARPPRLPAKVLARVLGASLDRQLAAGVAPESSALLAARARQVVAISWRRSLARNWEHLLRAAAELQGAHHPARPLRCAQIIAAEPAVRELVRHLTVPLPVASRGVAMATVLLTDAGSPVYSRLGPVSLAAALDEATAQLDPAIALMTA
jgi:hypothetical protein